MKEYFRTSFEKTSAISYNFSINLQPQKYIPSLLADNISILLAHFEVDHFQLIIT